MTINFVYKCPPHACPSQYSLLSGQSCSSSASCYSPRNRLNASPGLEDQIKIITNNTNDQTEPQPDLFANSDRIVCQSKLVLKGTNKNSVPVQESTQVLKSRMVAIESRFETLEGKVDKVLDLLTKILFPCQQVREYTSVTAPQGKVSLLKGTLSSSRAYFGHPYVGIYMRLYAYECVRARSRHACGHAPPACTPARTLACYAQLLTTNLDTDPETRAVGGARRPSRPWYCKCGHSWTESCTRVSRYNDTNAHRQTGFCVCVWYDLRF
jgi:hypothetical protein